MFGMGGSEIIVILIVALLFLGPDKLPQAAKQISKGIRDIKKQSRSLQRQIEDDEQIGGAIRDLKSALRGEEAPPAPKTPKREKKLLGEAIAGTMAAGTTSPTTDASTEPTAHAPSADTTESAAVAKDDAPSVRLPPVAGEPDADGAPASDDDERELAAMIKPAAGTVAKGTGSGHG